MARELGIEPRLTESKSVVLPLHNSRTKTGIPRGTRTPTNGFGDRHAAITSERYCLVPTEGNDPSSIAYQASALPLSYAGEISTALLPMQVSKHTKS
jgi:hypothetical protein